MKNPDWNDLRLFFHVAESGGLSGAARITGLSAATIGRRMLALEQQTGQSLFHRAQTGYSLTAFGDSLMARVRTMRASALPVEELLSARSETPVIRLSAGTGTAQFLALRHGQLRKSGDRFRLHFATSEATLDLTHREIDLGIRNQPPAQGNLASRKLCTLRFAPYRNRSVPHPGALEWLAMDRKAAKHPAAFWVYEQNLPICALAGSVATLHHLIRAGAGIGLMPCMLGDFDPTLERAGPLIEALTEHQYLVTHNDDRHRTPVRQLTQRIAKLYADNADLLAGARPLDA